MPENSLFGIREVNYPLLKLQPDWNREEQHQLFLTRCQRCGFACGRSLQEKMDCGQYCSDGGAGK